MLYFLPKQIGVLSMGSKRGPLSKAEVFYISEQAKIGKTMQEISVDLDRPVKSIEKAFTKAQKEGVVDRVPTAGGQLGRYKGSVVMTENASSISDAKQKKTKTLPSKCITKIKKDE
jgi:hypothetical protein